MSIVRATAHALLAAPFIVDGLSAAINPDEHAEKAKQAWQTAEDWGAPKIPERQLRVAARVTGVASAGLGITFLVFPAKRVTATALATLTVPLIAMNAALWLGGSKKERRRAGSDTLKQSAIFGGLLLATVDLDGRPSRKWRRYYKNEQKQAVAAIRASLTDGK